VVREALRQAAEQVASEARRANIPADVPYRDPRIDTAVHDLPGFVTFVRALGRSTTARRLYGRDAADRWALAWAYAASDATRDWEAFWRFVADPDWRYVAVANVSQFEADAANWRSKTTS
jgi:hypothetical protein